jgi:hypothetical protein
MIDPMRASYALASLGVLVIAAACGGKVVFVEDGDGDGNGGSGTTGSTSATKSTSKSTGQTTQASTGVTSVSNASQAVGVTSGGPPFCHFGSFDDQCQGCIDQSLQLECGQAWDNCNNDQGCLDYDLCVFDCADNQGCCNQCANAASPQSVALHDQLLFCVFCQSCQFQCPEAVPGFCGF